MNAKGSPIHSLNQPTLFSLEVIPPTGIELPTEFEVKFENRFGLYCCLLKSNAYSGYLRTAKVIEDETVGKLAPLFDYWVEEEKVNLTGWYVQDRFYVKTASTSHLNAMQTEFFIHRLLSQGVSCSNIKLPCESLRPLKDVAGLNLFYRVLGHTLPEGLYNWFGDELENISRDMGHTQISQSIRVLSMVAAIDWSAKSGSVLTPSVEAVRAALDSELYGMDSVKEQLCEIVAIVNRSKTIPKWGILLVGPPGIGKTRIANVFANSFGLPMFSIDFSSVRDEEGLSGTFRIYENSRSGCIINAMYNARTSRMLMLFNEIDKIGSSHKTGAGDPTTVLLSLLDRMGLWENFLETVVPTDNIFAIATANDISKLSKPLLDRFIVVSLPAYTPDEKRVIWEKISHPKMLALADVAPSEFTLTEQAKQLVFSEYAVEPGVRDLERISHRIIGHYCKSDAEHAPHRSYTDKDVRQLLGPSKVVQRSFMERPGQINTAYLHDGKAVHFLVEASVRKGNGKFQVLGIKSEQQQAYCEIAYEAFRSACPDDLSGVDVTVFSPHSLPDTSSNYIGCAVYAAIHSALCDASFDPACTMFLGGVDLFGNIYLDENDIVPLLNTLPYRKVKTLFAPSGTSNLIHGTVDARCSINIVEAPDARLLMTLAGGKTKSR